MALCCRTLTFLWFACASRPAHAEQRVFVELDYQTDATLSGCPSEAVFKGMVQDQLGYDPFRAGASHRVAARAHADRRGIKGVVQWRDASGAPRGERELSSERVECLEFARVLSFTIVVQIQLLAQRIEQAPAADPLPPKEEPASPPSVATPPAPPVNGNRNAGSPPIPDVSTGDDARRQLMLGGGPSFGFGFTPRTAIGGRVFAMMRVSELGVELGAEASLPSRHALAQGKGFEQQFIAGALAGCAFVRSLSGCIVNKWGSLQVRGFGVDVPRESSGLVGLAGLRLTLSEHLATRWVGAVRVEGLATLAPWRVALNQRQVWVTPTLSLSLGADLGAVF